MAARKSMCSVSTRRVMNRFRLTLDRTRRTTCPPCVHHSPSLQISSNEALKQTSDIMHSVSSSFTCKSVCSKLSNFVIITTGNRELRVFPQNASPRAVVVRRLTLPMQSRLFNMSHCRGAAGEIHADVLAVTHLHSLSWNPRAGEECYRR